MEPADDDWQVGGAELAGEVERARKLVRLHADQADKAGTGLADVADDAFDVNDRVALVVSFQRDLDLRAECLRFRAIGESAIDAGEAVGGDARPEPLNDVAFPVVMGRLD